MTAQGSAASRQHRAAGPKIPARPGQHQAVRLDAVPEDAGEAEVIYDVPLFYVGDVEYCMPSVPPNPWGWDFTEESASPLQWEQTAAALKLYRRMLGPDGYKALRNHPTATPHQLKDITTAIIAQVMGPTEDPKKNG